MSKGFRENFNKYVPEEARSEFPKPMKVRKRFALRVGDESGLEMGEERGVKSTNAKLTDKCPASVISVASLSLALCSETSHSIILAIPAHCRQHLTDALHGLQAVAYL